MFLGVKLHLVAGGLQKWKYHPKKSGSSLLFHIFPNISQVYIPGNDYNAFVYLLYYCCNIFSEGAESISTLSQTASVNVERIRALMEFENNRSLESLQKTIVFYQSCLNLPAIDQQSVPALHQILLSLGRVLSVIDKNLENEKSRVDFFLTPENILSFNLIN